MSRWGILGVLVFLAGITLGMWAISGLVYEGGTETAPVRTETLGVENYLAEGCEPPPGGCDSNHFWDSNACSCMPFNSCEEPEGGCGSNYYWDSGSCSCVYDGGACTEPQGGCPEGKYWDSSDCQCRSESSGPSCQEPSGGCGVNYYWDSSSCFCVYASSSSGSGGQQSCSEPAGGCGENSWWDAYSCSCNTASSCNPPSTGCGVDKYWDNYDCICRESCHEPSGGCGVDKYWDNFDCSCRSYSSCSVPSEGCGVDYYWDSYYCSCKPYQGYTGQNSCSPPSAGCGDNYYWDSYSCNCKQYPNNYGCYEPTGGCGTGWEWDDDYCACRSLYDDDAYYEAEDYSTYTGGQTADRLAYETPERISCVKSILTPTEYERLRFLVPANDTESDEIHNLAEKVESCWDISYSTATSSQVGGYNSPVESEQCLIDALGDDYGEIYRGEREPTYNEHLIFEQCFGKVAGDSISYITNDQSLPANVNSCLTNVLGETLYNDVRSGSFDVPHELRDGVDQCFGIDPQPFEEGQTFNLPDDVTNCLLQAVGEDRFVQIDSGLSEPTDEEKRKGEVCFGQLNDEQVNFLPPPPAQVPYLSTAPEMINFFDIAQEINEVDGKLVDAKVIFSGKGPPNSVVTIYIYSEPIVVTTKTDENGDWLYELSQPLEGESHVAYAIVRSEDGQIVRSTVFDFQVAAASDLGAPLLAESRATDVPNRFLTYAIGIIGLGLVIMVGGMGYFYFKKVSVVGVKKEPESLGSKGESDGKDTPGPIN